MGEIIRTEASNPVSAEIDLLSSLQIVEIMNSEDKKVAQAVEVELGNIAKAVDMVSDAFLKDGSLLYFGAGTSGGSALTFEATTLGPRYGKRYSRCEKHHTAVRRETL